MDILFAVVFALFVIFANLMSARRRMNLDYNNIGWDRAKIQRTNLSYREKLARRKNALSTARKYLKPYKEPMGEHCLANENCKVNLIIKPNGEKEIIGLNKIVKDNKRELFTARISEDFLPYYSQEQDYVIDFIWDNLCINFNNTTVYENIFRAAQAGMLEVQENEIFTAGQGKPQQINNMNIRTNTLLNINSATEAELTALPGINVAMAKRIIKYTQKNGAFLSLDDFFEKMKIKDFFKEKLVTIICVNDIGQKTEEKPEENIIDTNIPHTDNERIIDL